MMGQLNATNVKIFHRLSENLLSAGGARENVNKTIRIHPEL